jgi:hypothetical protein
MKWQNSIAGIVLSGLALFSLAACGQSEEPAVVTSNPDAAETNTIRSTPQTSTTPFAVAPLTSSTVAPASPNGNPPQGNPPSDTPGARPAKPSIGYSAVAVKLGVTEQALQTALKSDSQKPPDWAAAAKTLGVSEEALREALGFSAGGPPGGTPPAGAPPEGRTVQ